MPYKDKDRQREAQRRHYQANKPAYVERARVGKALSRPAIRAAIWAYLEGHPCVDCGESDPVVLEFDHREDKSFNIGDAASVGVSMDRLMVEIAKCDVRCANCHRRRTHANRAGR